MSSHARSLRQPYDPYGFFSSAQDQALLGYNGQIRLEMTALYPLGNGYRNYSPVLRRFQSTDSWSPFGRGGLNSYVYCGCDPVNHQDPSGHVRGRQLHQGGYRRRLNSTGSSSEDLSISPSRVNPARNSRPRAAGALTPFPAAQIVDQGGFPAPSPSPTGAYPGAESSVERRASGTFGMLRRSESFGGASSNLHAAADASLAAAANTGSRRTSRNPLAVGGSAQANMDDHILRHMAEHTNLPVDEEIYLRFNNPDTRRGLPWNVQSPGPYNQRRLKFLIRQT